MKNEKQARKYVNMLLRKAQQTSGGKLWVRKRMIEGIEVREFGIGNRSPVAPRFTFWNGWLMLAFQPQPVHASSFVRGGNCRYGEPDARTAATLTKLPADRLVTQFADPRPTIQLLFNLVLIVGGLVGPDGKEPIEVGLFPHPEMLNKHLFPDRARARCDEKTNVFRFESHDSLWLLMEFLGIEAVIALQAVVVGIGFGV